MAGSTNEDYGIGGSSSLIQGMSSEQRCHSADSLAEWRSCEQVENGTPSTSPPYWDIDDDGDDCGPKPSELYGKFTWKIESFSQINKRELRSNSFEVGGYKWYILIYPQGCDVSNHLSLFLCVANHDKLLPGWSHFAQFTIAVVNKDPKKSKYSDTLHRFWKKEHDWGWKKFMELVKVSDGFIVADTLVIKAQVQVIREKAHRPFRCLDRLYRRELVRVYLSNVEQICQRFVEERRGKLSKLIEDKMRWTSFRAFWLGIDLSSRRRMSRDKSEAILKVVVKHFFIEKEVTSTLVMDSLYSGLKALECQSKSKKGKAELDFEELPAPMIHVDKDMFVLADDVLLLLERAALEPLPHQPSPPKDEKGFQTRPKDGVSGEELNKDSIERDERRLTELGRRTVEIFVLAHIFSRIEVAYQEAVALKRQEELIREEEVAWQVENELRAKRTSAEKEKRAKKKQAKQKRNSRKGKDKGRDEKSDALMLDKNHPEIPFSGQILKDYASTQSVIAKIEAIEDVSDVSDTGDDAPEAFQAELEDRDTSSISDTSEVHFVETSGSERQNGQMEKRNSSVIDDSCSTCSTNIASPIVVNGSYKGNSLPNSKRQSSPIRIKGQQSKDVDHGGSLPSSNATSDADSYGDPQPQHDAVITLKDKIQKLDRVEKEERVASLPKKLNIKDPAEVEQHPKSRTSESSSSLFSPAKKLPSSALQSKRTMEKNASAATIAESVSSKELPSASPSQTEKSALIATRPLQISSISISESQKVTTPGMSSANQNLPAMTRPLSAPLVPSPRPATPVISTVQTVPLLSRSLSAVGRLGTTDPSLSAPGYVPQSYRNAIMGKTTVGAKSTAFTHTSSTSSGQADVSSQPPSSFVSSVSMFSQSSARNGPISARPGLPFGSVKTEMLHTQQPWGGDYANQEATNSGNYDSNDTSRLNIYGTSIEKQYTGVVSSNVTIGQAQGTVSDEFPHIGIINELLDDDQTNVRLYMNHHHALNRQYTFPRDVSTTDIGPSSAPCRNARADQYYGEGYHMMYGPSNGLNGLRDSHLAQMDPSAYANGHIDGAVQNQWPYNHADLSMLSLGSFGANGYSYQLPDNLNPGYGENGYNMYRPSNRR